MNQLYPMFGTARLGREALLACLVLVVALGFTGQAFAGLDAVEVAPDSSTAAERAENSGRDAELELYNKVLQATQGRGSYRLLINTAQKCNSAEGTSG